MTSEARFFVKRKLHKKCGVFEACKKAIGFFDTLKKAAAIWLLLFSLSPVAGYAVGGFYSARVLYMPVAAAEILRRDVLARGQLAVLF